MYVFNKLHPCCCALSLPRLFRRSLSSQIIPEDNSKERTSVFREELKAIDSEVLATAMGGDEPPEEPLLSTFEEGFGYFTTAAVNRSLNQYQFVRKVIFPVLKKPLPQNRDKSAETRTFVAMKLLTAHATAQIALGHSPEYDVFRKVESTNLKSPGFNHCLTLQRCFTAESEAGGHICFVTEALSSSLENLQKPGQNRFPLPVAKRITKQVLLALDYLHRECGYIHTDLKADNILASILPPANSRIEKYVLENDPTIYGPPLHLKSSDLPLVFSRSQPLPYFGLGGMLENISVRLVDYGQATPAAKPARGDFCQPPIVCAPEVTLKYPWTSAIDIWTVGCLLFQLLTEHRLFGQEHEYSHELHLQHIEECLGPFPSEFLKDSEDREKYFGTLLHTNSDFQPTSLEDFFQHLKVLDEDEIPGAADFIRKCLTLDPKLRPTAQELLKDDWLL
ncbi:Serine/threonine-protein kinase SRPK [Leucoagaricus sp. SymC.cos]|nr:Serine/threonine-protein kinase SRPK [Leucoagaricus sp. SymC.cos]